MSISARLCLQAERDVDEHVLLAADKLAPAGLDEDQPRLLRELGRAPTARRGRRPGATP
jgi:hypothetical protein